MANEQSKIAEQTNDRRRKQPAVDAPLAGRDRAAKLPNAAFCPHRAMHLIHITLHILHEVTQKAV